MVRMEYHEASVTSRYKTSMCLCKAVKTRDKVADTLCNKFDQVTSQHEDNLLAFFVNISLGVYTIAAVGVGPKLLGPRKTSEKLLSAPLDISRGLSVVNTNHKRRRKGTFLTTYHFTRLMQLIAMLTVLPRVGLGITVDDKRLKRSRTGLGAIPH